MVGLRLSGPAGSGKAHTPSFSHFSPLFVSVFLSASVEETSQHAGSDERLIESEEELSNGLTQSKARLHIELSNPKVLPACVSCHV